MSSKLYVGNFTSKLSESGLSAIFAEYGQVQSVSIIRDLDTNRSCGLGFVHMSSSEEALAAIDGLNGRDVDGRTLTVKVAKPDEIRWGSGSGSGRRSR